MKHAQIIRIVIASPSDVQAERKALNDVVEELNRGIAADRDLRIELTLWETDSHPGFHPDGPQGLIDPLLRIEDCDILVGIFWRRFGTPVMDAKSGTEHEFQLAYKAWKQKGRPQIMIYFNQRSYTPKSKDETDQWGQVLEFKRIFPKEGLWWHYKGKAQFEKVVRDHLIRFIIKQVPNPSGVHMGSAESSLGNLGNLAMQRASQNPFGLRGAIEPEQFVVPERLVREVTEDIVKKQSVSIVGARMMGKSSLLKFLASERCKLYYRDESGQNPPFLFAYIDFQEHSGKSGDELMPELARVVSELLPAGERFHGNTHKEALEWIKRMVGRRRAGSPVWVLLFDEFDRVVEMSGIDKTLFDELRSLPQHYNLCYVIASRRKLYYLPLPQSVSTSPFFNFFKEYFLTVWDKSTARTLMFKPCGTELKQFNDKDFASIVQMTACHPLLLQIACYHLFEAHRTQVVVDYAPLHRSYISNAESIYHYYWDREMDDMERGWLCDCWQALSKNDISALQEFQNDTQKRKNRAIRVRLAKLGLVLSESGPLELPLGVQAFFREILSEKR